MGDKVVNREKILVAEAGGDLDRIVAVEVMDLICVLEPRYLAWPEVETWCDMDGRPAEVRPYSTDIKAAWQVVDKMISEGYYFGLYTIVEDNQVKWDCFFSKKGMGEVVEPLLEYERVSEAICKAALLAKLGK